MRWNSDKEPPGFVLDGAIRHPIAFGLERFQPRLWKWLHIVARCMYTAWSKEYDEAYKRLADMHQAIIERLAGNTYQTDPAPLRETW